MVFGSKPPLITFVARTGWGLGSIDAVNYRIVRSRYHGSKILGPQQLFMTETAICIFERWKSAITHRSHACHFYRFFFFLLYLQDHGLLRSRNFYFRPKTSFFTTVFRPGLNPYPLLDLAFKKLCPHYLDWNSNRKDFLKSMSKSFISLSFLLIWNWNNKYVRTFP